MEWDTFGHSSLKSILDRQLNDGKFNHAYLFVGPKGLGKQSLAIEFARKIVKAENLNHPDILLLSGFGSMSVELVREAVNSASGFPFSASHRVVILPEIDQLNEHAANTLLKSLEEPSSHTIFILLSDHQNILQTIRSRCQAFIFNLLSAAELEAFVKSKNLKLDHKLIELAGGSPKTLLDLYENTKVSELLKERVVLLEKAMLGDVASKIVSINTLAELESSELSNLLIALLWRLRLRLENNPQEYLLSNKVLSVYKNLDLALNKKLLIQSLVY